LKLAGYLARLGYGTRREVVQLFREGRVSDAHGRALKPEDALAHAAVRIDGEPLDPPPGMVVMLHKPVGVTCSRAGAGPLIYGLLPPRWRARRPALSSVGRLDRDTSGVLLLTGDGALLHRIISPRAHVTKVYEATLAADLPGDVAARFASRTLMLRSESRPLAPAHLDVLAPRRARLAITEGRYHQVRRMFAATGNRVVTLQRTAVGGLRWAISNLVPGVCWMQAKSSVCSKRRALDARRTLCHRTS
jgi:16S rRNA pseudouridine516 synthase